LLLHGFPSSARQWEPLLTRLAGDFHLIAPDYPGFGHSDAPDLARFACTFDHLAEITDRCTEAAGLDRYTLVVQDYGGPIGFRLALAHPERVQALIVQNAVAHEDGLGPLRDTRRAFWADRAGHEAALRENFFSAAATRQRHVGASPAPERYDPDLWTDELAFLGQPGKQDFQTDLFHHYRSNVASYPVWQQWLRTHRPPLLVLWGRYDPSFQTAEARATAGTCPAPRSIFSTPATSPWTSDPTMSRTSPAVPGHRAARVGNAGRYRGASQARAAVIRVSVPVRRVGCIGGRNFGEWLLGRSCSRPAFSAAW
jgi:pimeloyl-ACP methyl ester carboxylesterase